MSSRLQLDVWNLSSGKRHLVNAYKVKAGIGVIANNTVIHAWAPCVYCKNERYINTLTFTFFSSLTLLEGLGLEDTPTLCLR